MATPADSWTTDTVPVVERALAVLRLEPDDDDVVNERIPNAADEAVTLIDDYLDRGDAYFTVPGGATPVPGTVLEAAAHVTVELYRRKDAPFGVLNSWSESDFGPVRIGVDWLKGVETQLHPYKLGWGVG